MKTTILKIEDSDDVTSIRDKVSWCTSPRILLVIPRKKRDIGGEVGLELINRAARANGGKLGLVTNQARLRVQVKGMGINVFRSVTEAERAYWVESTPDTEEYQRSSRETILDLRRGLAKNAKTQSTLRLPQNVSYGIVGLILIILGVFLLPSANVTIFPETLTQELTLDIRAVTSVTQYSITGVIPCIKKTLTLTGEKDALSSGTVKIGRIKAKGEVVVKNLAQEPIDLPEGIVVSTTGEDRTRFITTRGVLIQPGDALVKIPVEAVLAGESGNVGAGTVTILEGNLGSSFAITNENAFSGGSSAILPAPTEHDYAQLESQLLTELNESVMEQSSDTESGKLLPIAESIVMEEIIDEIRINTPGEASDSLSLSVTARFSILLYDPLTVKDLLIRVMDISIPEGYTAADDDVFIEKIAKIEILDTDEALWTVNASRKIEKKYSQEEVKRMVRGKAKGEAIRLLNVKVPHYRPPEIQTFVDWWPIMPVLNNRIQIQEKINDEG